MGKRGPKPTPTEVLKVRGSWRANLNRNEPQPCKDVPRCPNWLNQQARKVWKQIVPQLNAMGVLTKIDCNTVARYCDCFARWKQMAKWMDEHGEVYPEKDNEGKTVGVRSWPQTNLYHKLGQMLGRLEAEFGLTPSSRTRVTVPESDGEEEKGKARFFQKSG